MFLTDTELEKVAIFIAIFPLQILTLDYLTFSGVARLQSVDLEV